MSKLVLYGIPMSPPVRACLLTLNELEVPFEFKEVDLSSGQHMTDEFGKINPQRTVPVLDDNGTLIWDSHAICAYLVGKYGKTDSLYPKDLVKRAQVDQRLYFDASVLFMPLRSVVRPLIRQNVTVVMREKTQNIIDGYRLVETFLGDNDYITGNTLTIADFSCLTTMTSLRGIVDIDIVKFPKTYAWIERLSKLPYYEEANGKGNAMLVGFLKAKLTEVII